MTTVAVTGAASAVGRALLERLDADRSVTRIIGLDLREPEMPVAKLDFRVTDVRDALLPLALEGAETIVHLIPDIDGSQDTRFALRVHGTRRLLEAVARVGARKLVHVSSATVYGAHPDNPLPLDEDAPLRAHHDFPTAYHRLLAEELIAEFAARHADVIVTVLRPAAVLGIGVDTVVSRHLENVRLPLVAHHDPCVQFVDVDDLASAVRLCVVKDLPGAFNVAAEGWLTASEVSTLLGKRLVHVPEAVAFSAAERLWRWGLVEAPPGALRYLMYPWVMDTTKVRQAGWVPARSNREILRHFAATHHPHLALGTLRFRRRDLYASAVGGAAAAAAGSAFAFRGWLRGRP